MGNPLTCVPKAGLNFIRRRLSQADVNERADHQPRHLIKETVALEFNGNERSDSPQLNSVQRADWVGNRSAAICRKGTEIVPAEKRFRRARHGGKVEWFAQMPGPAVLQRRQDFTVKNSIAIDFSFRREAGMKGIRNEITAHDSDRGRQHAVQGRAPAISSVTRSRKINVSALGQRVHSCVGAAGAVDANIFATNLPERFFYVVLNAVAIRLAL